MGTGIYFDHNATTPVDSRVLACMLPYFSEKFGNAHSHTHRFGWTAEQAVSTAREQLAALINCSASEILFTSGATESLNIGLKGIFRNYTTKGKHFVTVQTEHKAVLDTLVFLEEEGASLTVLPVDNNGNIDLIQLENSIRPDTVAVVIMLANNETGLIHPMEKIATIVHAKGAMLCCDATQAVGKIPVDVQEMRIDLLAGSAHKFYGPKGAGILYLRRRDPRVVIPTMVHGGGHEKGIRSGTLNVPAIVGMGKAAELAAAEMKTTTTMLLQLREQLENALLQLPGVCINAPTAHRLPNTTSLTLPSVKAATLIKSLPQFALAMGAACSSANEQPSHVLRAMGLSDKECACSLRISLGKENTAEEIRLFIAALQEQLR